MKITKNDDLVATWSDRDEIWEIVLTTTYTEESEKIEKQTHSYSVKTFDTDFERALMILHEAVGNYFAENIPKLFRKDKVDVSDKSNEVAQA